MKYLKTYLNLFLESDGYEDEESLDIQRAKELILSSDNPYVKLYSDYCTSPEMILQILKEFSEQLRDNFSLTSESIGEELTQIVIKFFPDYSK